MSQKDWTYKTALLVLQSHEKNLHWSCCPCVVYCLLDPLKLKWENRNNSKGISALSLWCISLNTKESPLMSKIFHSVIELILNLKMVSSIKIVNPIIQFDTWKFACQRSHKKKNSCKILIKKQLKTIVNRTMNGFNYVQKLFNFVLFQAQ